MRAIRETFIETSRAVRTFAGAPEVRQGWNGGSVLPEFSMKGLVGHLLRATGSVEAYLDREEPSGDPVGAAEYYREAVGEPDIDSDLHRAIRQRGEDAAAGGRETLLAEWDALIERLGARLRSEPENRRLRVYKDIVIALDDYLVTRLVELVVHCDDVAASLGLEPPRLPPAAYDASIRCLVEVGRLAHGDAAVIRALTRRERDDVHALRVL